MSFPSFVPNIGAKKIEEVANEWREVNVDHTRPAE